MVVPSKHFEKRDGCEEVLEPDEDLTSSATAKVTHFRRATSVRFQTDMFECIVDHKDAEETTPYHVSPAQVAAYMKPPAFRPADILARRRRTSLMCMPTSAGRLNLNQSEVSNLPKSKKRKRTVGGLHWTR
jgi:hypothetical protein